MTNLDSLLSQKMKDRNILNRFNEAQALVCLLQFYIKDDEESAVKWGLSALEGVLEDLYKGIIQVTKEQALEETDHE
ncbi:hypothetical protein P7M46_07455 [Bisgaard Taxon 10/6]|uniref:hypothetical protein n=1 Tax=Exercitatus varius TaxID=67857 RepID=UPI00294AC90E|nr:hypothetical protein [Exercitatus varius]MDG2917840.1 hypothetical protein [Exercitatus varius]